MRTTNEKTTEWQPTNRSTRWYEWLLILLLLGLAGGVRAETVYKCTSLQADIAYQAQPCADEQSARIIEIPPAPPVTPSPQYAVDHESAGRPSRGASRERSGERREAPPQLSYECQAADGQVFYRHASCPHSIPARTVRSGSTSSHGKGVSRASGTTVSVSALRISREEACREIHRAGAAGRDGHEHDEIVSSYEHNLGRDPCR